MNRILLRTGNRFVLARLLVLAFGVSRTNLPWRTNHDIKAAERGWSTRWGRAMAFPHPSELRGKRAGVRFPAGGRNPRLRCLRLRRGLQRLRPVQELQRQFLAAMGAAEMEHDGFRHPEWVGVMG
jgi:hypothetical protein